MRTLTETIQELIDSKKEDGYWDFKEFWEEPRNDEDLLHDIICMANNLMDKDAYIIFGVQDATFKVVGVENDENRKSRQNVIDFLKDKKFVRGIRPEIDLQTIKISNHELDILIIKNTSNTPYYLEKRYKGVQANLIYTRIHDTNTPKDCNADIDKIELLWKKHFGILKSGLEKMEYYMEDYSNWEKDLGNKDDMFYKFDPDYKIYMEECEEYSGTISNFYLNPSSTLYKASLYYNDTRLFQTYILAVDEFRKYIVLPKEALYDSQDFSSFYCYYIQNSTNGKLLKLITDGTYNLRSREYYEIPVLLFKNENEKNSFELYAKDAASQILESEIEEHKKLMETGSFTSRHDSYIKSYILYKKWKSSK